MGKYYIHYTDNNRPPIEVDEFNVDESTLDVALFGRVRQEYGERLNQNLLNLVENFSMVADPNIVVPTPTPMPSFSNTPAPSGAYPSPTAGTPTPTPTQTPTPTPTQTPSPTQAVPMVAFINPDRVWSYTETCEAGDTPKIVESQIFTVSCVGGVPPYTYNFFRLSGALPQSINHASPGSNACTISFLISCNSVWFSSYSCSVTDSLGNTTITPAPSPIQIVYNRILEGEE